MDEVINSYNQTLFKVNGFSEPILVGKHSIEADNYLQSIRTKSWIYITAYNPLSVMLSDEENESRNLQLKVSIKNYPFETGIGVDPEEKWPGEKSFFVADISKEEGIRLAWKYGQKAIVYGELGNKAELIITIHTAGNTEIIKQEKTAFLYGHKIQASDILKCYDWAIAQRDAGNCVVSGFDSQIEKDVLHYLLKGKQPIIVALARASTKKIDAELEMPLKEGRLLIITPFNEKVKRVTEETVTVRNRMMIELADSVAEGFDIKKNRY